MDAAKGVHNSHAGKAAELPEFGPFARLTSHEISGERGALTVWGTLADQFPDSRPTMRNIDASTARTSRKADKYSFVVT